MSENFSLDSSAPTHKKMTLLMAIKAITFWWMKSQKCFNCYFNIAKL